MPDGNYRKIPTYWAVCTRTGAATQKRAHRLSVIPIVWHSIFYYYNFIRCLHHHLSLSVFLGWVLLPDDIINPWETPSYNIIISLSKHSFHHHHVSSYCWYGDRDDIQEATTGSGTDRTPNSRKSFTDLCFGGRNGRVWKDDTHGATPTIDYRSGRRRRRRRRTRRRRTRTRPSMRRKDGCHLSRHQQDASVLYKLRSSHSGRSVQSIHWYSRYSRLQGKVQQELQTMVGSRWVVRNEFLTRDLFVPDFFFFDGCVGRGVNACSIHITMIAWYTHQRRSNDI